MVNNFPASIVNLRIKTQIETFFENIKKFYEDHRITWTNVKKVNDNKWYNDDFEVFIFSKYADGAIKSLEYIIKNLPGYKEKPKFVEDLKALQFIHRFRINIPRSYPRDLHKIRITLLTPLYHPRVSPTGDIRHICFVVRGEIDRVLEELLFFVLMKKDRVEPPSIYKKADYGLNSNAMKWYIKHMEQIIRFLEQTWIAMHKKDRVKADRSVGKKVVILED